MRVRTVLAGLVLVATTAMLTRHVVSQEQTGAPEGEGMEMTPEMLAYMNPGEHHEHLKALEGKWNVVSKYWMDPSAPPSESKGTSTFGWVLGGRYLQENFSVVGARGPFEGLGFLGYDNHKKKYVDVWMDSMGTGMMASEGTCDDSHKVFTYVSEGDNPWTGGHTKYRNVLKVINESKLTFEMFETGAEGKERKSLEVVYTRG